MLIADRLRALREQKQLSQGDVEKRTLDLPVQCLFDSTSRKLVHGSVQTDKDFQKIRQLTTGEKRRLGELGNSRPFQKAN